MSILRTLVLFGTVSVAMALSVTACGGEEQPPGRVQARPDRPHVADREPESRRYSTRFYSAQVPNWPLVEDKNQRAELVRSKWEKDGEKTSVLIDAVPGETQEPAEKAASIRAVVSQESSYRELGFDPVRLGGRDAYRWVFELEGDRRVDYFIGGCGGGYAVLGSTSPSRFRRYEATFRAVAASLDCKSGGQGSDELPAKTPRECDSGELRGDLVVNQGEVSCAEALQVASNSSGPNSATGPAGWDCSGFATALDGTELTAIEGYSCSRGADQISLYAREGDGGAEDPDTEGSTSDDPDPGSAADCPRESFVPPSYGNPGYCAGPEE